MTDGPAKLRRRQRLAVGDVEGPPRRSRRLDASRDGVAKIPHVHEAAPVLDACEGQRPASRYRAHQREEVGPYPRPVDEGRPNDDELESRARGHLGERILGRELGLAVDVVRRARLRRADVDEAPHAFTRGEGRGARRAVDVDSPKLVPAGPRMGDVGEMHNRVAAAHVRASHVVAARARHGTQRAADETRQPGDQDAHRAGYYNTAIMLAVIGGSGVYNIEGLQNKKWTKVDIVLRRALGRGAHRRARR